MSIRNVALLLVAVLVVFGTVMTAHADEAQYQAWLQKRDQRASLGASFRDDTYAMIDMGDCYIRPDAWCGQSVAAGADLWFKAAAKGEYWLLNRLILLLAEGEGAVQYGSRWQPMWDQLCATAGLVRDRYQESALSGKAKTYVGLCFMAGRFGVLKKDARYGLEILDWAASNDRQVDAAVILSDTFHHGRYGVAINMPKSEHYGRLAASSQKVAAVPPQAKKAAATDQAQVKPVATVPAQVVEKAAAAVDQVPVKPVATAPAQAVQGVDAWEPALAGSNKAR
ncbi:MAG: hypothetical protein HQL66_10110 [Magnetococcales bacterium]|nr:hypothetical protein [Magnetococcales bacterium]